MTFSLDFRVRQSFKGVQCEGFWVRCADVKEFTALTFCATPWGCRGDKAYREQSKCHESKKPGNKRREVLSKHCTAKGFASKFPGPQGFHRDPTLCEQSFGEGTWENFGWFYTAVSISDLLSPGVSKEPRLCLQWMPLFISCEMLALLSKYEWLRLESKGELHHEARVDKRKNLFWVQDCSWRIQALFLFSCVCNGFLLSLENS